jgi:hypothetical protein
MGTTILFISDFRIDASQLKPRKKNDLRKKSEKEGAKKMEELTTTIDANSKDDRLLAKVHPNCRTQIVPATRDEWLNRKSKLWSLVQSVDPTEADLTSIIEEKVNLDAFNLREM